MPGTSVICICIYWLRNEGKDQESIQLSTTPDPGYQWESDNVTVIHHKPKFNGIGLSDLVIFAVTCHSYHIYNAYTSNTSQKSVDFLLNPFCIN